MATMEKARSQPKNRLGGPVVGFVRRCLGRKTVVVGSFGSFWEREKMESSTIGGNLALHRTITSPTAVHPRQSGRYAGTIVAVRRFLVPRLG